MMINQVRRFSIFFVAFVLVSILGAALWWQSNHTIIENKVKQIVLETAGQSLNGKIEIDQLRITFPPAIKLEGVRFYGVDGKIVTEIPQVRVTLNYWKLITGQIGVEALEQVALQSPLVYVTELKPGQWNLSDLLRQETATESTKVTLSLLIQNAQIYVNRQNLVNKEMGLNGQIHIFPTGQISGTGDFVLEKDRGQVEFSWYQEKGTIKVSGSDLSLTHGSLAWLSNQEPKLTNWAGVAKNYRVEIQRLEDQTWLVEGEGELQDAGISWQDYHLTGWNGKLSGTNQEIEATNIKGNLNGQPFVISGKAEIQGEKKLNLTLQTEGFQLGAIPLVKAQEISGVVSGDIEITGTLDLPIGDGKLSVKDLVYQEAAIGNFTSEVKGDLSEVILKNFEGQIFSGELSGAGRFNWKDQLGEGNFVLAHIYLDQIPKNFGLADLSPLKGSVSGEVSFSGGLKGIRGNGELQFSEAQIRGIPITQASGEFAWAPKEEFATQLHVLAAGGSLEVMVNSSLLEFTASQIEAASFQEFIPAYPIGGSFSGRGSLQKNAGTWQGAIDFVGENGLIVSQPFNSIKGRLLLKEDGILGIDEVSLIQYGGDSHQFGWLDFRKIGDHFIAYPSTSLLNLNDQFIRSFRSSQRTHQIKGWLALDGSDSFLEVQSSNFRGEMALPFLPQNIFLSGNITNQLTIQGNLANPSIKGKISLTNGSAGLSKENSILIDHLSGKYERKDGLWKFKSFRFENWSMNFSSSGWYDEKGGYEVTVSEGQFFSERPLGWEWPYPVSGLVHFGGVVKGQGDKYTIDAQLAAPLIEMNGQKIENVNLILAGDQVELRIPEFSFSQGDEGKVLFQGYANGPRRMIYGEITAEKLKLSQSLPLATLSVPELEGLLSGNIKVTMSPGHIETDIKGFISQGTFRKQHFDQVRFHVTKDGTAWDIDNLTGKIGTEGFLAAEGGIDSKGNIDIQIGGRDLDASILPDLAYQDIPLTGKLQIVGQASGTLKNPEVALSGNITPGGLGGVAFDNFQTLIVLKDQNILIEQMSLVKGIYQASLDGKIPLAALEKKESGRTESMDLNLRLDNANLAILPTITPFITEAEGATTGQLHIKGTLAHPNINGTLGIQNGIIHFDKVKEPLENIQLALDFKGESFVISQGSAKMGKGKLNLSGQGGLAGTVLSDYRASLVAQQLEVTSPYYKGEINGKLELVSGVLKPKVQGDIRLDRVTISVPISLFVQDSQAFYLPETDLDIQLHIGQKVRFYDPVFYDISPQGKLRIRRTIQKPALMGQLEVNSGRIWYFNNQFDILEGKANFGGFTGLIPEISLRAQTRMANTQINLQAKGIATQMEFVLSSEPAMSQDEIRNLLLFKTNSIDNNPNGLGQQLTSAGALALLEMGLQAQGLFGLEKFAQANFGVDEVVLTQLHFSNQQNTEGLRNKFEANYGIRVGKSIGKNVFISNALSFEDLANGITNLRYDFNRYWNISVEWEREDKENRYRVFFRGRF